MKPSKLVKKLKALLSNKEQKRKKHRKELKELLKRMKKKEKVLQESLATETDQAMKDRIDKEISILHAQRKKGLKVLKSLEESS
ncbi:MAG TPA: hypothetical protein ENJ35_10485 [Gammaproteobacteria bacterium]|nr:hypothetical protein [Gammaproteobacteria bacterium]